MQHLTSQFLEAGCPSCRPTQWQTVQLLFNYDSLWASLGYIICTVWSSLFVNRLKYAVQSVWTELP